MLRQGSGRDGRGFSTTLDNPDAIARLSASLELAAKERWDMRLQYDSRFAKGHLENGGQLPIGWRF